jgi:putative transposase
MVSFVDQHRGEFGVEPTCSVLQMGSSTYYAAKKRQPSARSLRDAVLKNVLFVLWTTNRKLYGAHKLWLAAQRAGHEIGRDQVACLMRELGIRGVSKFRKKVFTTRTDPGAARAIDLVKRDFSATHPNGLRVTDLTHVPTRTGMAYVCFITDAFSRTIVGWRVAAHMRTDMVLDALEMARSSRQAGRFAGLVTHSDAGSQFTSVRFTERLDDVDAAPSIGTVGDCVRQRPRRGDQWALQDRVRLRIRRELATLSWVHWFNEERLHGYCGDIPPAEFEAAFYAAQQPALPGLGNQ